MSEHRRSIERPKERALTIHKVGSLNTGVCISQTKPAARPVADS
jgi:hypothetical protein